MKIKQRLKGAARASATHLGLSALVGLICAILVFYVWYPFPYSELVGGRNLFLIVMSVDIICGPLLTLIVYTDQKSRRELTRDIAMIVAVQLCALAYGLHSVAIARPVFLSFEGDRFRVVTVPDIDMERIHEAADPLRSFSFTGPTLIAAALAEPGDPNFLESIKQSVAGMHPSFRPSRWRAYEGYKDAVLKQAVPLSRLRDRYPAEAQRFTALPGDLRNFGYLPLIAGLRDDWVVVLDLDSAEPAAYLHLDGWE